MSVRKISDKSIGGAQYFSNVQLIDKSRYSWVYIIKTKDQVFQCFLEWKALVEKATKKKVEPSEQTMEVNTPHLSLKTTSK